MQKEISIVNDEVQIHSDNELRPVFEQNIWGHSRSTNDAVP